MARFPANYAAEKPEGLGGRAPGLYLWNSWLISSRRQLQSVFFSDLFTIDRGEGVGNFGVRRELFRL